MSDTGKLQFSKKYHEMQKFLENEELGIAIPDHLKDYNAVLDVAHDAWKVYGTAGIGNYSKKISRAAKVVCTKFPDISLRTAKNYVYQAINLFKTENIVDKDLFKQMKLQELEKLLALAYKMNDIEAARRIIHDQNELMGVFDPEDHDLPPELFAPRLVVYTIDSKDVGREPASRRELWKQIQDFKISKADKKRLQEEIGPIEDVEHEEIDEG